MNAKIAPYKSERVQRVERLILSFADSDHQYAAVKDELVKEYRNRKECVRAIRKIATYLKEKDLIMEQIRVYNSAERVFLEK